MTGVDLSSSAVGTPRRVQNTNRWQRCMGHLLLDVQASLFFSLLVLVCVFLDGKKRGANEQMNGLVRVGKVRENSRPFYLPSCPCSSVMFTHSYPSAMLFWRNAFNACLPSSKTMAFSRPCGQIDMSSFCLLSHCLAPPNSVH